MVANPTFNTESGSQCGITIKQETAKEQYLLSLCGFGAIAQLVERLFCKQKVRSSSLRGSTMRKREFDSLRAS